MITSRSVGETAEPKRDAGDRHAPFRRYADALPVVLQAGDSYHAIIEAKNILGDRLTGWKFIPSFYVIRRANDSYDVIQVDRIVKGDGFVTRVIRRRSGVPSDALVAETASVLLEFSQRYEDETGYEFEWEALEMDAASGNDPQCEMMAHWNGLSATPEASEMGCDFEFRWASGQY